MIGLGDEAIARQRMTHVAAVAPAHRVGLAGEAEGAAAGFADLPRAQMQVDDRIGGEVPWMLWLTPMVQKVIRRLASATIRAAASSSLVVMPQSWATRCGG